MLIAAVLFTATDEIDWTTDEVCHFLEKSRENLSMLARQHEVCLLTDQPGLAGLFKVPCKTITRQGSRLNNDQIRSILSFLNVSEDTSVAIINLHSPFLEHASISEGITRHNESKFTYISLTAATPSPCQIEQHLEITAAGSVHLPSSSQEHEHPASWVVSKVFPFPWEIHTEKTRHKIFLRDISQAGPTFIPLDDWPDSLAPDQYIFIYESKFQARVGIMHRNSSRLEPIHLNDSLGRGKILSSCFEEGVLKFHFHDPPQKGKLSILPFTANGPLPEDQRVIHTTGKKLSYSIGKFTHPVTGILYTLSKNVMNGPVQITTKFDPGGILWQGSMNLQTQKIISGRQSCPEILSFSQDFVIGSADDLNDLSRAIRRGRVRGVMLHHPTEKLHRHIDLLRIKAIARAQEEKQACYS